MDGSNYRGKVIHRCEIATALKSKKSAASGAAKMGKKVAVAPKYRNPANAT
jgi:hypothetical protein